MTTTGPETRWTSAVVGVLGVLLVGTLGACSAEPEGLVSTASINGACSQTRAITLQEQVGEGMTEKTLALTFDDGPSESTGELSTYLAQQNIAATFFVNGANVQGREAVLDQQLAEGHLLANHTHTHAALTALTPAQMLVEVGETDKLLTSRVALEKLYFRPPFGDWNEAVAQALSDSDMKKYQGPVGWDIGDKLTATTAADWDCWDAQNGTRTVQECGDLYLREIREKRRGVVLLHDGPPGGDGAKTVAMMRYVIPLLKAEGYTFTRIDQVQLRPLGSALPATPASPAAPAPGAPAGPPPTPLPCAR